MLETAQLAVLSIICGVIMGVIATLYGMSGGSISYMLLDIPLVFGISVANFMGRHNA